MFLGKLKTTNMATTRSVLIRYNICYSAC